jgi:hypothetical protein
VRPETNGGSLLHEASEEALAARLKIPNLRAVDVERAQDRER